MLLPCAGGARCVSQNGHFTGYEPPSNGIGSDYSIVVSCNSSTECSNFLDALRGRQKPSPPPVRVETPPQSSPPSVPARAANPSDFHDALNGIPWRNGGTKDLDDLVKNTIPAQNPQRPPSPQLRYAAFAQAAGFDANGEVGSAIGGDLNGTIGTANVNCVNRAKTSCGDEGYCMATMRAAR